MAKIKIQGDTSEIKKSILDLSKDVQSIGKSKIALFDKDQKDFLSKEAGQCMSRLRKSMETNGKQILKNTKLQNEQGKSLKDQLVIRERLLKLMQKQVGFQKEMKRLEVAQTSISGGGGGMLGKVGGTSIGSKLLKMSPWAAVAGIGLGALSRSRKAVGTFEQGVDTRVALRGRGIGDMALEDPERAAKAGMNAQDMRKTRLSAMDIFGKKGASQQAVTQRAEFERGFGVKGGTLAGMGGQLRGRLGGQEAEKAVMTIQAALISSGITDEIGPYLETAASMLTSLNENGFTFNDSALAVLNNLTQKGVAAERAGRLITGVDESIKRSSGEANALFQQVFKGAGIGGKTVGGLQAAIRSGGLLGANVGVNRMIGDTDRQALKSVGIGNRTGQKVASSAMKLFDQMFGGDAEIDKLMSGNQKQKQAGATRRLQRMNFIMNTFGLDSEVQAAEVNTMLRELADPETSIRKRQDIEKQMKNMQSGSTELGNLKLISKSVAGNWDETKKLHATIQDQLGTKLAPAFLTIDKTMMKLDAVLSSLLNFFGIKTADQKAKQALTGEDEISKGDFTQFTMGDPIKQKEFAKNFAEEIGKKEQRLKEIDAAETEAMKPGGRGRLTMRMSGERQKLRRQLTNMQDSQENVEGLRAPNAEDPIMMRGTKGPASIIETELDKVMKSILGSSKDTLIPAKTTDTTKVLVELNQGIRKGNRINERNERNTRKVGTIPAGTGKTN